MPHIGNDIVDLTSPANARKSTDLRYLKKILTDTEIRRVRNSEDPDRTLWSCWAVKEAAYKVLNKQARDAAFVPRRWPVNFEQPFSIAQAAVGGCSPAPFESFEPMSTQGEIEITEKQHLRFLLYSSENYIHCLAAEDSETARLAFWRAEAISGKPASDPSLFVRSRLADVLSTHLQVEKHQVEIRRDSAHAGELHPPAVYLRGIRANIDISLSHDGQYAAYAFLV